MIEARRTQTTFADGLIAEEVSDLWEPWMRHSDAVLEDAGLVEIVCQALSKRCKKSKTRGRKGRKGTPVRCGVAVIGSEAHV